MPNWAYTELTVRGTKQQIKDFCSKYGLSETNPDFDFNKVIPQPLTKEECEEQYLMKGGECVEVLKDRPWFNWYDWNYAHWGTKWNACEPNVEISDSEIIIWFSTAWCCPRPVLKKLKQDNPDVRIKWEEIE